MPPKKRSKPSSASSLPAYGTQQYWETRYQDGDDHEWYFNYAELSPLLDPILPATSQGPIDILEVGCGTMPLAPDLATNTDLNVLAIDYSPACITPLQTDNDIHTLTYKAADATKLTHETASIPFIVEKGTLDAIISDSDTGSATCKKVVAELSRVSCCTGGYIVIISHNNLTTEAGQAWLEDVIIPGLLQGSPDPLDCFRIEAHVGEEEEDAPEDVMLDGTPAVYIVKKTRRRRTRVTDVESFERVVVKVNEH